LTILLLVVSFAVILGGARLFTNAVEWLGHRWQIQTGAVGSVLAAVSTALPESVIPVVAIVGGEEGSGDVALGAILGAPLLLATIAMALVGVSAIVFRRRREQGRALRAHRPTLKRDLVFFLVLLGAALALGAGVPSAVRVAIAPVFVLAYALYVVLTLRGGGEVTPEAELDPLTFDPSRHDPPVNWAIGVQFLIGLGAIIGGAHLFVEEVLALAQDLPVSALVLSLLLAPLATELPEKANSVVWIRDGKDSLALGNITGAMVFQSTVPVAVGIAFTDWRFDRFAALAAVLALAGGVIAVWALHVRRHFSAFAILAWAALFAAFVAALVLS
jgi:cation:H+ antiporter